MRTMLGIIISGMLLSGQSSADDPAPLSAEAILKAHNRERAIAKLPKLTLNKSLSDAALIHAKDMAKHKSLRHEGTDGSTFFERIEAASYRYQAAAENVARGQKTVEDVMRDWMKSPGHHDNIIGDYLEIGVAVVADGDGQYFWCVDFGKPWPKLDPQVAGTEVIDLINEERTKAGKKPFRLEPKLAKAAAWQARFTADGSVADEQDPKKTDVFEKIKEAGLKYKTAAQAGAVGSPTPLELVKYLLGQPDYRKALLEDFQEAGAGYAKDKEGRPHWCILFGKALTDH